MNLNAIWLVFTIQFGILFPTLYGIGFLIHWPLIYWITRNGILRSLILAFSLNLFSAWLAVFLFPFFQVLWKVFFGAALIALISFCSYPLFCWSIAYTLAVMIGTCFEVIFFEWGYDKFFQGRALPHHRRVIQGLLIANLISVAFAFSYIQIAKKSPHEKGHTQHTFLFQTLPKKISCCTE